MPEDEDVDNHKDVQSMVNFKPGAAMTTDEVRVRLKELQVITAEQFNSPDLNIRFAEENDFSARTKKELQQQLLNQSKHGVLVHWVLQDDGSRLLELVRRSEIEGRHKETRSSWAHPENRMGNHRLNVNGKIICISVVDCFVIYVLSHASFISM